jgi:hypothetical protein
LIRHAADPGLGQTAHQRAADAAGPTGDQRYSALKLHALTPLAIMDCKFQAPVFLVEFVI